VQRVAVVGSGGAGKTTFATELGRRTGLPVIHLDRYFWKPGWVSLPPDEWRTTQRALLAGDRWVVDGNYGATFDLRLARADTVIVLSLPRWRCLLRVLRRWWGNRGRAVQADGCPEHFDWAFLRWVWRYPVESKVRLDAALAQFEGRVRVVGLTSPSAAQAFLERSTEAAA